MQSTMISAAPVSVYPPSNRKRTREYSDEEHDKKRSHRMVEQRRRERMNGLIDELSALIPLSFLTAQPNRTRPNILTAAISYLEAAQKVLSAVEGASSLSLTRRQINDSSSNAHFNIDSMISAHHGHGADSGSAVAMAQHHQDAVHAASEQSAAMAAAKTSFHVHHGSVSSSPAAALAQHHHQHHHHHPHHHDGGMGVSQMPLTLNGSSTGCVNLSNIEASGVTIMAQAAHHASQVQVGSERAARTRSTGTRRSTTPTTSPRTTSARTSPTAAILHTNTSSISHPSNAPSASAAIINRNSSSSSASHMSAVSQHSTAHHSVASPHHHDQQSAMSAIMEMLHSSSPHRSPVASSPSSSSSATTSPHHHHFYPHLPEPVSVVPIDHHDDMAATSLRELESLATATTAPLNSTATTATTTTSAAGATTTATSTVCGAAAAAAALASSFPEANESENNNLNAHATVTVEPSHYLHHGVSIDELTMYS